ncbi:hypothetical protein BJX64DRAFT_268854 [Aspergillus heterothallicus]
MRHKHHPNHIHPPLPRRLHMGSRTRLKLVLRRGLHGNPNRLNPLFPQSPHPHMSRSTPTSPSPLQPPAAGDHQYLSGGEPSRRGVFCCDRSACSGSRCHAGLLSAAVAGGAGGADSDVFAEWEWGAGCFGDAASNYTRDREVRSVSSGYNCLGRRDAPYIQRA